MLEDGLRRRHHRHPQPRRAAAGRHADRRRSAAVHRPALLRAGNVPCCRSGRIRCAASSCATGLTQLGEEGAIQVFRPVAAATLLLGAVGQTGIRSGRPPSSKYFRRLRGAAPAPARQQCALGHRRRPQGAEALHRRQRPPYRPRRGGCPPFSPRTTPRSRWRWSTSPRSACANIAGLVFHANE